MGHTRIGRMNRSKSWREVCTLFNNNAVPETIAKAILDAVHKSFNYDRLNNDAMYKEATWLLVQLGIAAKGKDFAGHLRSAGLNIPDNPSLPAVEAAIHEYMDDVCWNSGGQKTDLGEIAQQALLGTLCAAVNRHESQLLLRSPDNEDYQTVFKHLGDKSEFSQAGSYYFGEIMNRAMQLYLSKELPGLIGKSDRLKSIHEKRIFDAELKKHCMETAVVVKDYCVEWLGLHNFTRKDMSKKVVAGFATYGLEKMFKAMKYGKD